MMLNGVLRVPADELLWEDVNDLTEMCAALWRQGRAYPMGKWVESEEDDGLAQFRGLM